MKVKLSAYEQAINVLNDAPLHVDKKVCAAFAELKIEIDRLNDELRYTTSGRNFAESRINVVEQELTVAKVRIEQLEESLSVQSKAVAEEMLKREHMENNWNTMANSIKNHYEAQLDAEARLREQEEFIYALSEKAPHLMGCALGVNGVWICDERCLVAKTQP